jgi:hypothetical protein
LAAGGTTSLFPQKQEAGQRYLSVIIQSWYWSGPK